MRKLLAAVTIASAVFTVSVLTTGALRAGDWTGGYVGLQTGLINSDAATGGGTTAYGVHGGYDFTFGSMVLGGELELSRMGLARADGTELLGNVGRIKLRAGRDFGSTMAYAIMGGVSGDSPTGSETGVVYGLGVATRIGTRMTLSGEALRQVFDNYANGGASLKTDSFNLRVSFRF